jgi:hypothetical protein
MPTSYTTLLGLAKPQTGDLTGTWGDTVNSYITEYLDGAVAGAQVISGSQTAVTLSTTNGSALVQAGAGVSGSSQYAIIRCTGNPAGMLTITAPATSKTYLVVNATSTNQDVKIVGAGPTTGVIIPPARSGLVFWSGTDFVIGSVAGPASSTDNAVVRYDGTTGKVVQNSGVTIDDSNNVGGLANLNFSGTGNRITGDFSNATLADRVMFQTSTVDGSTSISALPNGTSTATAFTAFANANPTNASLSQVLCNGTESRFAADRNGSGTYLPMTLYTGGSERVRVDISGNVGIGTSSPSGASGTVLEVNGGAGQARFVLKNNTTGSASTDGSQIALVNSQLVIQNREASEIVFETNGAERMRIDSSGNVGIGTDAPATRLHVQVTDIVTAGVSLPLRIDHQLVGSPGVGIGVGVEFAVETSVGTTKVGATIEAITTDLTGGSQDFDLLFKTMFGGSPASEKARLTSNGFFQFNSGYGSVATAFGCRAWVNFNGIGAIQASGNVTSVTDNGTGDYTINFTNAMPDGNYAPVFGYGQSESAASYKFAVRLTTAETGAPTTMTTTALRVISGGTANLDFNNLYVAIFR